MKHKMLLAFMCVATLVLFCSEGLRAAGEWDCVMTPATTTMTRGQTLEIDVDVTNHTGFGGWAYFASKVTMPDSTTTDWVYGPVRFWLGPYGQQSGHITYDIPTSWPVGTYTYHSYVGMAGVAFYGESEFDFLVAQGVPKTGQTTSYATGDDGDLQEGLAWPNPRFTDNGNGTVTDNLTGLIWLKDANCFGGKPWADALNDCNGLASGSCGLTDGSIAGDWRLPHVKELYSLVHHGVHSPAVLDTTGTGKWREGDPFTNLQSYTYWSASTVPSYTDLAWFVHMGYGTVGQDVKYFNRYVWPVRGPN